MLGILKKKKTKLSLLTSKAIKCHWWQQYYNNKKSIFNTQVHHVIELPYFRLISEENQHNHWCMRLMPSTGNTFVSVTNCIGGRYHLTSDRPSDCLAV